MLKPYIKTDTQYFNVSPRRRFGKGMPKTRVNVALNNHTITLILMKIIFICINGPAYESEVKLKMYHALSKEKDKENPLEKENKWSRKRNKREQEFTKWTTKRKTTSTKQEKWLVYYTFIYVHGFLFPVAHEI